MLSEAGFEDVELNVVQPAGIRGEAKLINPITMQYIADAVIKEGLASREEIKALGRELYAFAENPRTVAGLPRVIQAWGRRRVA